MIAYKTTGCFLFRNVLRIHGSVFPKAFMAAIPNAIITTLYVFLLRETEVIGENLQNDGSITRNNALWSGFTFLVVFLVVFRTSQAYNRFWEGCTETRKMGAEWFDACSALIAFSKYSSEPPHKVLEFENLIIRLFSMLHAVALGEIEDAGEGMDASDINAFGIELIDGAALNDEALETLRNSTSRVELIFQWTQQYIVEHMKTGVLSIPAPILTRAIQELSTGMVHFHEAMRVAVVPFPFPYAQTCDMLLLIHWCIVPFIIAQWVDTCWWAGIFSFILVSSIWSLEMIAVELENPFGRDLNDIDVAAMQLEFNSHLRVLITPKTLKRPFLKMTSIARKDPHKMMEELFILTQRIVGPTLEASKSLNAVWDQIPKRKFGTIRVRESINSMPNHSLSLESSDSKRSAVIPKRVVLTMARCNSGSTITALAPTLEDVRESLISRASERPSRRSMESWQDFRASEGQGSMVSYGFRLSQGSFHGVHSNDWEGNESISATSSGISRGSRRKTETMEKIAEREETSYQYDEDHLWLTL